MQVSQEKLLRALASEKQVARRLSTSSSVGSGMYSTFVMREGPNRTILVPAMSQSLGSSASSSSSVRMKRLNSAGSVGTGAGLDRTCSPASALSSEYEPGAGGAGYRDDDLMSDRTTGSRGSSSSSLATASRAAAGQMAPWADETTR